MSEWAAVLLKDVTTKIGSGATPTGGGEAYKESGISLIRSQNVLDFKFSVNGLAFIDDDQAYNLRNVILEKDDVLLNITGDSVARCCMLPSHILPGRVNQHVAIIRANRKISSPRFLHYNLLYQKDTLLSLSEIGATRRALTKTMLENFELFIPTLDEQEAIAEVLSSFDDKIDLLQRTNKTLEQLAEILFRQWFVEEADDSWDELPLGKAFDIGIGRTPPRLEKQWFTMNPDDIKWVSIKDMGSGGLYISTVSEYLTEDAIKTFNIPIIPKNTVMLSFKMTIGRVAISTERMVSNEAIAHFKQKDKLSPEFLYLFLKLYNWTQLGSTSSIVEAVNSQMIKEINIAIPDDDILKTFQSTVSPYFEKIKNNQAQISTLSLIRDSLLPKLMNGTVKVQSIKEQLS